MLWRKVFLHSHDFISQNTGNTHFSASGQVSQVCQYKQCKLIVKLLLCSTTTVTHTAVIKCISRKSATYCKLFKVNSLHKNLIYPFGSRELLRIPPEEFEQSLWGCWHLPSTEADGSMAESRRGADSQGAAGRQLWNLLGKRTENVWAHTPSLCSWPNRDSTGWWQGLQTHCKAYCYDKLIKFLPAISLPRCWDQPHSTSIPCQRHRVSWMVFSAGSQRSSVPGNPCLSDWRRRRSFYF